MVLEPPVNSETGREEIPDDANVFRFVHRNHFTDDEVGPGTFMFRSGERGVSVDWDKYSTAEETKQRTKKPADNGVVRLKVEPIRALGGLNVEHAPIPSNRAHSEITGAAILDHIRFTEVRLKLLRIAAIVLHPDPL